MAQLALGVGGAIVGSFFGMPQLGFALGAAVGGVVFAPKPEGMDYEGPRMDTTQTQTSCYGTGIPKIYGTMRVAGNVIWAEDVKEHKHEEEYGGGKGGSPTSTSTTYTYTQSFAISLGEGEIDTVSRVWADSQIIYDLTGTGVSAKAGVSYQFYPGSETQAPDGRITAWAEEKYGAGTSAPAFRGQAYVVFYDFEITDFGNRIPAFNFEVVSSPTVGDETVTYGTGLFDLTDPYVNIYNDLFQLQRLQNLMDTKSPCFFTQINGYFIKTNPITGQVLAAKHWGYDSRYIPKNATVYTERGLYYFDDSYDALSKYSVRDSTCKVLSTGDIVVGFIAWSGVPNYGWQYTRFLVILDGDTLDVKKFKECPLTPCWGGTVTETVVQLVPVLCITAGRFLGSTISVRKRDSLDPFATWLGYSEIDMQWRWDISDHGAAQVRVGWTCADGDGVIWVTVSATMSDDGSTNYYMASVDMQSDIHVDVGFYQLPDDVSCVGGGQCIYDELNDAVWFVGDADDTEYGALFKFDISTRSVTARTAVGGFYSNTSFFAGDPISAGTFFITYNDGNPDEGVTYGSPKFYEISSFDGSVVRTFYPDDGAGYSWIYDPRLHAFHGQVTSTKGTGTVYLDRVSGDEISIRDILLDLCSRDGSEVPVDASAVGSRTVQGYIRQDVMTVRAAMEPLQQAFFFDYVESDGYVVAVPRGGSPVAAIPYEHLGAHEDGQDATSPLEIKRTQDTDLPKEVDILYLSPSNDYQQATQRSTRQVTNSVAVSTVSLPMAISDDTAATAALVLHHNAWTGRNSYSFTLPRTYAYLEPTDVVTITDDKGTAHTVRLTAVDVGQPGVIACEGVSDSAAAYSLTGSGTTPYHTESALTYPSPTRCMVVDGPVAVSGDTPSLAVAVAGTMDGWTGAEIQIEDSTDNWSAITAITTAATIGKTVSALDAAPTTIWDEGNTLTVQGVSSGFFLSSASADLVMQGYNTAMVGSEMIRFRTAELQDDGRYLLSGLMRGVCGTEWAMEHDAAGENFVLVRGASTSSPLVTLNPGETYIGQEMSLRAVGFGDSYNGPDLVEGVYQARALMPYAPCHVSGARLSGNLALSWIRRTRVNGEWRDSVDVSLGETSESYEVDIVVDDEVVRTISTSSPSATYTVAQYNADMGSSASTVPELTVRIYQISEVVGRGYPAEEVV